MEQDNFFKYCTKLTLKSNYLSLLSRQINTLRMFLTSVGQLSSNVLPLPRACGGDICHIPLYDNSPKEWAGGNYHNVLDCKSICVCWRFGSSQSLKRTVPHLSSYNIFILCLLDFYEDMFYNFFFLCNKWIFTSKLFFNSKFSNNCWECSRPNYKL